jgi:hypothetical protein
MQIDKYNVMGAEWVAERVESRRRRGWSDDQISDELDRTLNGYLSARRETDTTTVVPPRPAVQEMHEQLMADQGTLKLVEPKLEPFGVNAMSPAELRAMELDAYKKGKTPAQWRADLEMMQVADEAEGAARFGEAMRFYERMKKQEEMKAEQERAAAERASQPDPPGYYRFDNPNFDYDGSYLRPKPGPRKTTPYSK